MENEFSREIFDKYTNVKFRATLSSGSGVVPRGRSNGQTDMTKLTLAFHNFANAWALSYNCKLSLTSVLDWGLREVVNVTLRPLYHPERAPVCIKQAARQGGAQRRSRRVRRIWPPSELDPRTVHPVASRYIYWATPALHSKQPDELRYIHPSTQNMKAEELIEMAFGRRNMQQRTDIAYICLYVQVVGFMKWSNSLCKVTSLSAVGMHVKAWRFRSQLCRGLESRLEHGDVFVFPSTWSASLTTHCCCDHQHRNENRSGLTF
jgi:hypothetical protein